MFTFCVIFCDDLAPSVDVYCFGERKLVAEANMAYRPESVLLDISCARLLFLPPLSPLRSSSTSIGFIFSFAAESIVK